MSEKVLGFYKKDGTFSISFNEFSSYMIDRGKLVPVVSLQAVKERFVPENIKLETVTDKYGMEWMFSEYQCPKCGNEFPTQGKCQRCGVKREKHDAKWVLIAPNSWAETKDDLLSWVEEQAGEKK